MRSGMVLTSHFNFPFVTSTPFSMCLLVDVETAHSKRILSFFALFNLMNGTIKFCGLFLLIFFEDGRPTPVHAAHFLSSSFLRKKSMNMPLSTIKKTHHFSRIKGCFFIVNVAHTETLVFSFLLDEVGWFKNNRQIYLQYTKLHIYVHIAIYLLCITYHMYVQI